MFFLLNNVIFGPRFVTFLMHVNVCLFVYTQNRGVETNYYMSRPNRERIYGTSSTRCVKCTKLYEVFCQNTWMSGDFKLTKRVCYMTFLILSQYTDSNNRMCTAGIMKSCNALKKIGHSVLHLANQGAKWTMKKRRMCHIAKWKKSLECSLICNKWSPSVVHVPERCILDKQLFF